MKKDVNYVILKALKILLLTNLSSGRDIISVAKNDLIDSTVKMITNILEDGDDNG